MNLHTPTEIFEKVREFLTKHPNGVLEILGPTASGKTGFSIQLAKKIPEIFQTTRGHAPLLKKRAEIISVDSKQIYKEFDISSAKITEEEMSRIPHHGIDLIEPNQEYNVYQFQQYAFRKIEEIQSRGNIPILCGGTMLWLDAISENYVFSEKGTKSSKKSPPLYPFLKIGIEWPRDQLYARTDLRAKLMFEQGLIEETKKILRKYPDVNKSAFTSFGYQEIKEFLDGNITEQEALEINQKRNRNYAKKQLTWWRGREDVLWMDGRAL